VFTWDDAKNRTNIEKHGLSFATASRIFEGPVLTAIDDRFEYGEVRSNSIGAIDGVLVIVVTHTDRDGRIRIISARPAKRAERTAYEEALRQGIDL
jgi:uncharacterized DUF497 family protein